MRTHVTQSSFTGLIGVARRDITPPAGIFARNWGACESDVAAGLHRPLNATLVTLQDRQGGPPALICTLDLGWWRTKEDEWFVRGGVLDALQLPEANVLISLTHTHAGPSICREDSGKPGGHLIAPYLQQVRDAIIAAAKAAIETSKPASLEWGHGSCGLARNRDFRDPNPTVNRFLTGYNPGGCADDVLLVGRVTAEDGAVLAVLVNYACHPTTLAWQNHLISPDFIGAFNETVESHCGALSLFLQGASGELQPVPCYTHDVAVADAHGRSLAYAALSVLENMLPARMQLNYRGVMESGAPLAAWEVAPRRCPGLLHTARTTVDLELKPWPPSQELSDLIDACEDRAMQERLRRKERVRRYLGDGDSHALPLWIWKIGEAVLVAQMNEAYSAFQTELRNYFPDRTIIVMNLTNGSAGYLPPSNIYSEDIYPVWQTPYESGCLERLIERSREIVDSLIRA